jgi:CRP-like cAMP-binding protein
MREALQAAAVFQGLSARALEMLASSASEVRLEAGEKLFRPGDPSTALYVVAGGLLEARSHNATGQEVVSAELGPGEIAGAIQILTGGERNYTVIAKVASRLAAIPKSAFDQAAEMEPAFVDRIRLASLHRLRQQQLALILAARFEGLSYAQMFEIQNLGTWLPLEKGHVLFRQDDPGDSVFLLVSGLLGVLVRGADGAGKLVNRIRHGELVGEMAVLSDENRSATIYAIRQAELLRFGKAEFLALIEKYPRFALQIARLNIDRLRETLKARTQEHFTSVAALVPASPDLPLGEFARRLTAALAHHCKVLHISREGLRAALGVSGDSEASREILFTSRFPAWLGSLEGHYRFILLETAWDDARWTDLCIQQSDQVISVAQAGADPALSAIEVLHVYRSRGAGEME